MERTVLHVDCNKFYASVECLHARSCETSRWRWAAAQRAATELS